MAKRKRRKRRPPPPASGSPASAAAPQPRPVAAKRRAQRTLDDRPPAPWGSFPLVEIAVAVGLVLFVVGFFFLDGDRGTEVFVIGLLLASLAGLELSIREHFAGFRSHSLLLGGAAGVATMIGLYSLADVSTTISAAAGALVFGLAFWGLGSAFARRSGQRVKLR
jgi:hypothetical protein